MSKREDSGYLKKLSRVYKKEIKTWSEAPLVVIGDDASDVSKKAHDLAADGMVMLERVNDVSVHPLLDKAAYIPLSSFMFMDKVVEVKNHERAGVMPYNYFYVSGIDEGLLRIDYPTLEDGVSTIEIPLCGSTAYTNKTPIRFLWDGEDIAASLDADNVDVKTFIVSMALIVLAFFKALEESDSYPVEVKGTQHRKVHAKKPWARSDLSTIQFLNRLPVEKQPHKGGTHSSPRYHQRRGAWRSMTNPIFKNHPKYGDRIWIKPYWAGEKEATVNGVTYKVL